MTEQPVLRDEVLYEAWVLLANVSEGDWSKQTQEWQDAMLRWRDRFHATLLPGPAEELLDADR